MQCRGTERKECVTRYDLVDIFSVFARRCVVAALDSMDICAASPVMYSVVEASYSVCLIVCEW